MKRSRRPQLKISRLRTLRLQVSTCCVLTLVGREGKIRTQIESLKRMVEDRERR